MSCIRKNMLRNIKKHSVLPKIRTLLLLFGLILLFMLLAFGSGIAFRDHILNPTTRQIPSINPIVQIEVSPLPSPLLSPIPTPTIISVNVILQTPKPQFDPIKIAKKLREAFPDAYKGLSDETIGNAYIKKFGTDELIPPAYVHSDSSNSNTRRPITCITNTIGSYTYTNCY